MDEKTLLMFPESRYVYSVTAAIFQFICNHVLNRKLEGLENIPSKGPAIICPNHQFYKDLGIVGATFWKEGVDLHYFAKKSLFQYGAQIPLRLHSAFPYARRRPNQASYNHLEGLLDDNQFVLIFPQATRVKEEIGKARFDVVKKVVLPYEDERRKREPDFEIPFIPVGLNYDDASELRHWLPWNLGVKVSVGESIYSDKNIIDFRIYDDDEGEKIKKRDYRSRKDDLAERILGSLVELSGLPRYKSER
ncbi:MAG: 1-acyl-sn-glycerol-3-phosphate acyltransferase [Nanoarchaeota archaeon]|nr:1-acyl-sn-glycerol-3-phosphate acyltransferase [Nanoarchaeota archaeon]